jgi:antitoxin (DNA-binding transcriptional repressor) of toxin-antitoxin stability system
MEVTWVRQRIGLGQLRNSAAYYFDRVAAGESFDVVRRGRMVAQIVPFADAVHGNADAAEGDLDADEAEGSSGRMRRRPPVGPTRDL